MTTTPALITAIKQEFGDALCSYVFPEDGNQCLRIAQECKERKSPYNPHDDAIPQEEALEKMRAYLRKEGDD